MPNLLEIVQEIVKNTNNSLQLADIIFGTVSSVSPLKIRVEQKLELTEEFLVLTKNVIDYSVDITLSNWNTENSSTEDIHTHTITGTKSIIVHNALALNDKVILIQQAGGQKFVVLDKVY